MKLEISMDSEPDGDLKIAIEWRADVDNEFCTNVVNAFDEAGVHVIILDQVKDSYVQYDGSIVQSKTYQGSNIAEVMKDVNAVFFTGGEDISPTLLAVQDWHHIEAEID